jgi:phosphoenolpyruvate synthase/pyruvate phosphate dikinase
MWKQLLETSANLEKHFREMQDMEFTIEKGKLFMLQTRTGKRTAQAAVRIACDMFAEGLINKEEAVLRVAPAQLDKLLHPSIPEKAKQEAQAAGKYLAKGTGAAPGAACGQVVFEANDAVEWHHEGKAVILVRPETTPDDAHGMAIAKGILTSTGGPSSHAALVARGWGIPCIVGCEPLKIDLERKPLRSATTPSAKATGFRSTAAPVKCSFAKWSSPRQSSCPQKPSSCWVGLTSSANWECMPTPTPLAMPNAPATSEPPASACAAPSTCSWNAIDCQSFKR